MDVAANLATYLTQVTGTCLGVTKAPLKPAKQRELFGEVFSKDGLGSFTIDGQSETVTYHRTRSYFGHRKHIGWIRSWKELGNS